MRERERKRDEWTGKTFYPLDYASNLMKRERKRRETFLVALYAWHTNGSIKYLSFILSKYNYFKLNGHCYSNMSYLLYIFLILTRNYLRLHRWCSHRIQRRRKKSFDHRRNSTRKIMETSSQVKNEKVLFIYITIFLPCCNGNQHIS